MTVPYIRFIRCTVGIPRDQGQKTLAVPRHHMVQPPPHSVETICHFPALQKLKLARAPERLLEQFTIMRFSLLAVLLSSLALSSAHIFEVTGPAKYEAGANTNYPLTFVVENGPITKYVFHSFSRFRASSFNHTYHTFAAWTCPSPLA
jgi:hypothetical protein